MDERKWIACSDNLPDTDAPVLAAYRSQCRPRKRLSGHGWSLILARYTGGEWRFLTPRQKTRLPERIRYWMPLPPPPPTYSEK